MKKCAICDKGLMRGNKVSHSHRLKNRVWKPNLQNATIMLNGQKTKTTICTKCLKTVEKA